jgi:hypothetical protein
MVESGIDTHSKVSIADKARITKIRSIMDGRENAHGETKATLELPDLNVPIVNGEEPISSREGSYRQNDGFIIKAEEMQIISG